jgi:hypothetical protein
VRAKGAVIACWVLMSILNFGAMNASFKRDFPKECGREARKSAAVNVFFSAIPLAGTVTTVAVTGFFQDGFDWRLSRPCQAPEP